jgi:crotonobetainyl-CoA:carnitine CoA-transferase CaiB-like acyl-CoA transferase
MLSRRIGVLSRSLLSLLPCGIGASERVALSCHTIAGEGASRVPLSGIRVVDLTRILAGPFCTLMLADMGAEVIKVETPRVGDPLRQQGVIRDGLSWYFAAFNRNKRSLSLNLRSAEGRAVLARLIAASDVLVENFRPGILAQMGFDAARLRALKPDLVYCNISGFGTTGPYRDRPSFDFIAQAMSGLMAVTGTSDGPPLRAGPPIADLVAGLQGALGICAALVKRGRTGRGETVGASLNNGLISLLGFLAANHLATGEEPARSGNDHAIVAPYGMFRTRDGEVALAPSQEQSYQRLIDALGLPELHDDPRFATNDLRVQHRAAINAAVEARLVTETTEYWIEKLNAAGVPCGRVMGLAEVFADPQVIDQQMVVAQEHPGHGTVQMLGFPIKFAEAPCALRHPAPEKIGADTDAVLQQLGYSTSDIAALRHAGVV